MPVSWTTLFRVVIVLLMAAHVFYLYAFARVFQEVVGLDFTTVLASSWFALVMLVPLAWAAALPDLPQIIRTQIGKRRWRRGCCAECGYFVLHVEGGACPECGAGREEPNGFVFGWATLRRFVVMALAAWVLGCVSAEVWTHVDETNFALEAQAYLAVSANEQYSRPRRWPMQDQKLYYTEAEGVTPYSPEFILP